LQGRLWPVDIVRTEPAPYGSADCKVVGVGDDHLLYVLKRCADGALLPATELLCTKLAEAIGLPVPLGCIARLPTGEECFASREEGGVASQAEALAFFSDKTNLLRFKAFFVGWFAFDLFVHNEDRHLGNFLVRASSLGHVMLGIDFSRAFLTRGWPLRPPPLGPCNTVRIKNTLRAQGVPYTSLESVSLLNRLLRVPDEWMALHVKEMPEYWLTDKLRRHLIRWWRGDRHLRLRLMRRNFANGRYL
jgi:hypothetical protein